MSPHRDNIEEMVKKVVLFSCEARGRTVMGTVTTADDHLTLHASPFMTSREGGADQAERTKKWSVPIINDLLRLWDLPGIRVYETHIPTDAEEEEEEEEEEEVVDDDGDVEVVEEEGGGVRGMTGAKRQAEEEEQEGGGEEVEGGSAGAGDRSAKRPRLEQPTSPELKMIAAKTRALAAVESLEGDLEKHRKRLQAYSRLLTSEQVGRPEDSEKSEAEKKHEEDVSASKEKVVRLEAELELAKKRYDALLL